MDKVITIYEAKTHLSKYIKQAKAGKPVYIGSYGQQEVMLVLAKPTKRKPRLGVWSDNPNVMIPNDFDDPDAEVTAMFEDSTIFPDGAA